MGRFAPAILIETRDHITVNFQRLNLKMIERSDSSILVILQF
jgi:hypothetical protein